jgi:hypothetical protein
MAVAAALTGAVVARAMFGTALARFDKSGGGFANESRRAIASRRWLRSLA